MGLLTGDENLKAALGYAAIGWPVFPTWWIHDGACACGKVDCNSPGKHPINTLVKFGHTEATTDAATIKRWWTSAPEANIGMFLAKAGLCALDIDPRNGGYLTLEQCEALYGSLESNVTQYTGGGGEHRIFKVPENVSLPGKLGKGIDIKHKGYVVLDPSNHLSGKTYQWEGSSDPRDGAEPSPWPASLAHLTKESQPEVSGIPAPLTPMSREQLDELRSALAFVGADDRTVWLEVGMALHNDVGGQDGYDLWGQWSQKSDKFNQKGQVVAWNSFKRKGISGITKATIFKMAQDAGWVNTGVIPDFVPVEMVIVKENQADELEKAIVAGEPDVPYAPGVIGDIQDYYNKTAFVPQPMFAFNTGLGLVSVLAGRVFRTNKNNYPCLYFLNVGKSSTGKDHIKIVTSEILEHLGKSSLYHGNGYTSESGIFSTLEARPIHIALIDEMGMYIQSATDSRNFLGRGVIKSLLETHVNCRTSISDIGRAKDTRPSIIRPHITIQGLTTPSTLFNALDAELVSNGFVGRFIIHHSIQKRIGLRDQLSDVPIPSTVKDWYEVLQGRMYEIMPLNDKDNSSSNPATIRVDFTPAAWNFLKEFSDRMVARQEESEAYGVDEIWGRTTEIAMRVSLVWALSKDPMAQVITLDDVMFCCRYMEERHEGQDSMIRKNMAGSTYGKNKNKMLDIIKKSGKNGKTMRELKRISWINDLKPKELSDIFSDLQSSEQINYVNLRDGKPGRAREAWIEVKKDDSDSNETEV